MGHPSTFLGLLYVVLYFGAVLAAPVLALGAGILFCLQRVCGYRTFP